MKWLMLMPACLLLLACAKQDEAPEPVRPVLSLIVQSQDVQRLGRFAGSLKGKTQGKNVLTGDAVDLKQALQLRAKQSVVLDLLP